MSWFSIQPPSSSEEIKPEDRKSKDALPFLGPGVLHPVSSRYGPHDLFGHLNEEDTAWLAQSSGFVTETQTFYLTLPGGALAMCQVIHSAIGLWYPQVQFTFRYYEPHSKTHIWKSTNVTNFKTPPPLSNSSPTHYDRRSCQADQFSILLDPARPDQYTITGKHDNDVQLHFNVTRMKNVPGWKLGHDARGGFTYFGSQSNGKKDSHKDSRKPDYSAGSDGYLVHRFWPRCNVSGHIVTGGRMQELEEARAIFIHAVQGMRPNLIASRWNFCNFQSLPSKADTNSTSDAGVSLTLMEFTSVAGSYGPAQVITVGSVVVGDRLLAVACGPRPNEPIEASTSHEAPLRDPDTGYDIPSSIKFTWSAPLVPETTKPSSGDSSPGATPQASAEISLKLDGRLQPGNGSYMSDGLIDKVDVMAQIPYLVKKVLAAVAGARPYIYTWINPATATVSLPTHLVPACSDTDAHSEDGKSTLTVAGHVFNEATFISD